MHEIDSPIGSIVSSCEVIERLLTELRALLTFPGGPDCVRAPFGHCAQFSVSICSGGAALDIDIADAGAGIQQELNLTANGQPHVLLVDAEDMVIFSIRAFLQLETEYEIHEYTNPRDTTRHLETNPVDVIVSDYLMPKMNGIQLLAKAKEFQPEAARVLLTGHADKQSAIQAINPVGLYQYLEKPWDNSQLLLVINGAIERTQLLRQLKEKVSELDEAHTSIKDVQSRLLRAFL
jgi:DNA-binding NarL/FixJ family response regulator